MKIKKKTAFIYVILISALLFGSTFFPLRLYHENVLIAGSGEIAQVSDVIDAGRDAGDYFLAQRSHLQYMEIRIEEILNGEKMIVQLFGHAKSGGFELLAEEKIPFPESGNGFVRVPIDVDLTEGEEYVFTLRGYEDAEFRTAYEVVDLSGNPAVPAYRLGFYQDTGIAGVAVITKFGYRVPLGNRKTAAAAGAILLLAGVLLAAVVLYYKNRPEKNVQITLHRVLQCTLTPAVILTGAVAAAAVWPMQLFDDRLADIITYETGIAVFVFTCLYALWHKQGEEEAGIKKTALAALMPHLAIIVMIACVFDQCAKYMNALNDFEHHRSEAMIISLISAIILVMGWRRENLDHSSAGRIGLDSMAQMKRTAEWTRILLNICPLLVIAAGAPVGRNYYIAQRTGTEDPQFEIINEVLRYQIVSRVMLAAAVFCILAAAVRAAIHYKRSGAAKKTGKRDLFQWILYIITVVFFVMLYINSYGRQWITELIVMYALLFCAYLLWEEREQWLRDLSAGIILNFLCMAVYSMLHRYYFAYYYSRFSMHFHTVTVTAYYLLLPEAAALTLLLLKWRELDREAGLTGFAKMRTLWKELLLFGIVTSYLLMSLSRAGIFIAFLLIVASAFFVFSFGKGGLVRPVIRLFAMALALLIVFPMIFTGQRIISTVVRQPERFEALEPYPDAILRNPSWDSRWFMSIEVFTEMLLDRVIGGPASALSEKIKSGNDGQWVENDPKLSGEYGALFPSGEGGNADTQTGKRKNSLLFARANRIPAKGSRLLAADPGWEMSGLEEGDYSNGRLELYRAYLDEIEMTGHSYMGATLPNGDLAVHAHNIFLQTAFDSGIPTGIMLLVFGLVLLAGALRYYFTRVGKGDRYCLLPVLVVTGFGLTGMVEWIFHFCNPFTVMLMMSILPVLDLRSFREQSKADE